MSGFTSAVVATEILSLIICLILLFGSRMESKGKSKRTTWFILLIFTVLVGCFCDAVSWMIDGRSELAAILFILTLLSMLMTMVAVGVFFSYLYVYICERKIISKLPIIVGWILVIIGVIATIILSLTGEMFSFQNGFYTEEKLYSVYVIANIAYIVLGIIIVTIYGKVLDWYDKVASYAYMLIPMITAIISLFVDDWGFTYPAVTVSLLILYILIQSDRVKKLEKEGRVVSYQATHDELTGLYNRTAYQNRIQIIAAQEENCGVIFADMNGLKYANDTFGHEAGDKLLVRYAGILTDIFRMNEIYRLSGDEFVCILENVQEETFKKRVAELESSLNREEPPIACFGAVYGTSKDIEAMIKDAETRMYEEKKIVHGRFPQIKR